MRVIQALAAMGLLGCAGVAPGLGSSSSGEALYRDFCSSCHDPVPPGAYSDAQWRGVLSRMQSEAGLTDLEAQEVLTWLEENN